MFVLTALTIAVALFLQRRRECAYLIFIAAFLLGAMDLTDALVPAFSLSGVDRVKSGETVYIRGVISSDPKKTNQKSIFIIKLNQTIAEGKSFPAGGKLRIESYADTDYKYGDDMLMEGTLRKSRYIRAGKREQGLVVFVVRKRNSSILTGRGKANPVFAAVYRVKQKIKDIIYSNLSPPHSDVLSAMILGQNFSVPGHLRESMIRSGTWHLMVVSGAHTALLAGVVAGILKIIRVRRNVRFVITIILLAGYCILTGSSNSVVRATVMIAAYLVTFLVRRPYNFLNTLAFAALAILVFKPLELFNLGFELSFLSVFFIFWLYPGFKRAVPENLKKLQAASAAADCFCVSCGAWLGTFPLLAYVFNSVSIIACFANIVAAPLAMMVISSGLVLIVFGLFCPFFLGPIAISTQTLISIFINVHHALSNLPWSSISVPGIPVFMLILSYSGIMLLRNFLPKEA